MKLNAHIYKKVVTTLAILSLGPALVFGAGTPKPLDERGIIKSVDLDARTLVVTDHKNNSEQKFQWNAQTKFTTHRKSTSASALRQGERVRLTYAPGGGTPFLQSVHLTPAKTQKPGASNLSTARSNGA